jgi:hypothetical protein
MDELFDSALEAIIQSRKQLSRAKRNLQTRGYDDFIETGDTGLVRKTKQVASQISQLDREIDFIQKSGRNMVGLRGARNIDFKRAAEKSYAFEIKGGG